MSLALLAVCALLQAQAAPPKPPMLTAEERAPVAHVDSANDAAVKLLEQVVNINSGTQNFGGVRAVGNIFRAGLDALGFKTQWVGGTPFKRAGHLVAERPGTGPKFLL